MESEELSLLSPAEILEGETSGEETSHEEISDGISLAKLRHSISLQGSSAVSLQTQNKIATLTFQSTLKHGTHFSEQLGSEHSVEPVLTATKPFTVISTLITEGPYKGRQALIVDPLPDQQFPFLDLPLEIRFMIYKSNLARPLDLRVEGGEKTLRGAWIKCDAGDHHKRDTKSMPKSRKISIDTSLLYVNRQVSKEAAEILYRSNSFVFPHTGNLFSFLKQIGGNRIYLRDVEFFKYIKKDFGDMIELLAKAISLKRLCCNVYDFDAHKNYSRLQLHGEPATSALAKDLQPVLTSILRQTGGRLKELHKIVTLLNPKRSNDGRPAKCACRSCSDRQMYVDSFRTSINRLFEIKKGKKVSAS